MSADTAKIGTKVGRARRTWAQLWQVPAFCAGLLALLAVAAVAPWRHPPEWWAFDDAVTALRQGLETGRDGDTLAALADAALARLPEFDHRTAEVYYLAGSAYFRQASQKPAADARDLWLRASSHLEKALELGVEERDMPPLQYRLGVALCRQGVELPRCVELMRDSIDKGAEQPLEGYQLLLQTCLKLPTPDLEGALTASQRILELTDERAGDALTHARLAHAELLLRVGRRPEALKELERIGPKAPPALRLQARLAQARGHEEDGNWARAAAVWKKLLPDADRVPGGKARVLYALGVCCRKATPPDDAGAIAAWQEALALGGPEGQAAGLRLGALRLAAATPDVGRALNDWRQALAKVYGPKDYANPYLDLAQTRALFDRALQTLERGPDPGKAGELAELYRKVAPPGTAENLQARAAELAALRLQERVRRHEAGVKDDDVRAQQRRAAQAYEQAAQRGPEGRRAEALWRSARCYLAAKEPVRAAELLDDYVKLDKNEARLAEGWLALGEAFRAQGKAEQARQAYYRCLEYPATGPAQKARFQLALDVLAKKELTPKDLEQARDILRQNLAESGPTLDRDAHQKSVYKLAWVLLQMQEYDKAVVYLREAARQYPHHPAALEYRYQLGECCRRLADAALKKERELEQSVKVNLSETKRQQVDEWMRHHRRTRLKWLDESARTFRELADELGAHERARRLTDLEQVLLRRAQFGQAEDQMLMGEFAEALRLYQAVLARHRGQIEGLLACERIWELVGKMNQTPSQQEQVRAAARAALKLAEEDLAKMPADSEHFRGQGVWSKDEWQRWASFVQSQLNAAAAPARPQPAIQ